MRATVKHYLLILFDLSVNIFSHLGEGGGAVAFPEEVALAHLHATWSAYSGPMQYNNMHLYGPAQPIRHMAILAMHTSTGESVQLQQRKASQPCVAPLSQ